MSEPLTTVEPQVKKVTFGDGRYSPAMKELFQDSQRLLGLSETHAERLARAYGAELGRINAVPKISFGRLTKDRKLTLKESSSIKGLTLTYAISIAKLCVILQEGFTYGVESYGDVELQDNWMTWLNKAE